MKLEFLSISFFKSDFLANTEANLYIVFLAIECPILIKHSANLMQRGESLSFIEMSSFLREKGKWLYVNGKLVDVEGN